MTRNPQRRPGFTLLELLVVIALIALLASLTVGAVFRLLEGRKETNTNTHLRKIHMSLEQQWKAKIDQIKKEPVPPAIIELTKNANGTQDMDRARAFHLKVRLRQEFPQNFGDVYSTGSVSGYSYGRKNNYVAALGNPLQNPAGTGPFVDPLPEAQSSAMLVLILSQGAGGATTDPESIAPTKLLDFPQADGSTRQMRVFIDSYGTNIAFRRVADDDMTDVLADLNAVPGDPQDPSGRLAIQGWPNRSTLEGFLARPGPPPSRPYNRFPFDGTNRGPFAFSAGKNLNFFLGNGFYETDLDNMYSYRLQQAGRGN